MKTKIYTIFTNLQKEESIWTEGRNHQARLTGRWVKELPPTVVCQSGEMSGELQRTECTNVKSIGSRVIRRELLSRDGSWTSGPKREEGVLWRSINLPKCRPDPYTLLTPLPNGESTLSSVQRLLLLFTRRWHSSCSSGSPLLLLWPVD